MRRRYEAPWYVDAYLRTLRGLVGSFLRSYLPGPNSMWRIAERITAPTLVITGRQDRLVDVRVAPAVGEADPGQPAAGARPGRPRGADGAAGPGRPGGAGDAGRGRAGAGSRGTDAGADRDRTPHRDADARDAVAANRAGDAGRATGQTRRVIRPAARWIRASLVEMPPSSLMSRSSARLSGSPALSSARPGSPAGRGSAAGSPGAPPPRPPCSRCCSPPRSSGSTSPGRRSAERVDGAAADRSAAAPTFGPSTPVGCAADADRGPGRRRHVRVRLRARAGGRARSDRWCRTGSRSRTASGVAVGRVRRQRSRRSSATPRAGPPAERCGCSGSPATEPAQFTVYLAAPGHLRGDVPGGLAGDRAVHQLPPRDGRVVINSARWLTAVPDYGAPLDDLPGVRGQPRGRPPAGVRARAVPGAGPAGAGDAAADARAGRLRRQRLAVPRRPRYGRLRPARPTDPT